MNLYLVPAKILITENFHANAIQETQSALNKISTAGPVFLPTLPMPIASSQVKSKTSLKYDSSLGKIADLEISFA